MIHRRSLLLTPLLAMAAPKRPNTVILTADRAVSSQNLESIAKNGAKFPNAYAPSLAFRSPEELFALPKMPGLANATVTREEDALRFLERRTSFALRWNLADSRLDDSIGKLFGKLRDNKIENDTVVIFAGLSASAGIEEAALRVPLYLQWRGTVKGGVVIEHPVSLADVVATATGEARGDGVDLMPLCTGKSKVAPHAALYWKHGGHRAIRKGAWKLAQSEGGKWRLYQLQADPGEQHDLSSTMSEKREELQADYEAWERR